MNENIVIDGQLCAIILYASYDQPGIQFFTPNELPNSSLPCRMQARFCLLYTSPSPRDGLLSRMPSSA